MRIIHFLNHTLPSNGHVHVAVDLACVQSRMGHSVSVVSGGGKFDSLFATYGVRHFIIDQRRTPWNLTKAIYKLHSAISSISPEIIHAHMATSAGLAFLFRYFKGFKLVATVHNEFEKSAIVMGLADRVIAVSEAVAESMARRGVKRSKLRVVLNGTIGSPRLSTKLPPAQTLNRPAITFVGGLHPRKGVHDLIEAFKAVCARVPAASLYLVGNGPYLEAYKEQASQTGVGDRIEFCGCRADPRPYLLGSDLFVLASHAEPAGLVLLEAREAGCGIVATSVGGIPEMLDRGKAGILVPPRRSDLLADAIINALTDDTVLADMRDRSRSNLEHFTVDRASEECISVYKSALN
ncbi:MAG: glycosyltransferase family 4 protein [Verrucomicrobia bacterium]|nr:glycosyltransferase family 4 protein [Verrucomicrobiota bacterium]